jgi:2-aminobenzoylacetyl-CoA thioesterase
MIECTVFENFINSKGLFMKSHYIPEEKFPVRLNDHLFMLGNYFFNNFLVIGSKKSALFEVGISSTVDAVIRQLESLSVTLDFIIPSHPHSDHITGLPGLVRQFPDANVITAKGAFEFISHPKAAPLLIAEDYFMAKELYKNGIRPGRHPLKTIPDISKSQVIEEKISLDLGSISLDLITVGGHSPGNFIGHLRQEKIIFTSDSIGFHFPGRLYLPLFFTGLEPYLSTFDLIKSLNPSMICPAHQGPLKNNAIQKEIQKAFDDTHKMIGEIRHTHLTDTALAEKLFARVYRDEFTLYTRENILNCMHLLIKRVKEA